MVVTSKTFLLKNQPLFSALSLHELETISHAIKERAYATGDMIIEQDTASDGAYFIVEGMVKVFRESREGEEINLTVLGPGEVLGELSLIDDEPRSAYVCTLKPTTIFILRREDFIKILEKHPETAVNLLKTLAKRVRTTNQRMEELLSLNLTERTWKMLQTLSGYFPNKDILLSQEELASIIGATRARVTEVLNHLKDQGKISISHRKIHIS